VILLGAELLDAYKKKHPEARASLDRWRTVMEETTFQSVHDVRRTFSKSYDYVPPHCHVFDIAQGRHRLVALVDFKSALVNVDAVMNHAEYDRWRCA
jgi:mRNA-degrading endonuclease HigB of HigAB toxin-antitoxin module